MTAADSTRAQRLVRTGAGLGASDFPLPGIEPDLDWDDAATRIEFTLSTGDVVGLSVIPVPEDNSRSYVRKDGDETIFIVYRSTLDSIVRDPDSLKPPE